MAVWIQDIAAETDYDPESYPALYGLCTGRGWDTLTIPRYRVPVNGLLPRCVEAVSGRSREGLYQTNTQSHQHTVYDSQSQRSLGTGRIYEHGSRRGTGVTRTASVVS